MRKATKEDLQKRDILYFNIRNLDMGDYREVTPIIKDKLKVTGYQFNIDKGHIFLKINDALVPVDKSGDDFIGVNLNETFSELIQEIYKKIEFADTQFSLLAGLESNVEF